jgi:4-amino-4-deoxy-L-arabinose transferase-like glycosyltransferase
MLIAAITCAVLLPFINKAIHIDDPLFVWTAKHILDQPFDPFGFEVNWYGRPMPMHEVTQNPPLTCYWLAAFGGVLGFGEPALHLAMLLPAIGLSLGVYELARRLDAHAMSSALFALATPAVLVSATTLMSDVMMTCGWVWAVVLWIDGLRSRRHGYFAAAAMVMSLAILTKYFAVALLPLMIVYTIVRCKRLDAALWWLLVPLATIAAYELGATIQYGHGLMFAAARYAAQRSWLWGDSRLPAALGFAGGCTAPLLFALPWLVRRVAMGVAVAIVVAIAMVARDAQVGLWTAAGMFALWLAVREGWQRRDAEALMLTLWVLGVFVFAWRFNWSINARTILPLIPALAVIVARRVPPRRLAAPIALGLMLSLTLAWADQVQAGAQRQGAAIIAQRYEDGDGTLWLIGHWGVQYYLQARGGKQVNIHAATLRPGDRLVLPLGNTNVHPPLRETLKPLDRIELPTLSFVALQSSPAGAGFYARLDDTQALPFAFGHAPPARFEVLEVVMPVTRIERH